MPCHIASPFDLGKFIDLGNSTTKSIVILMASSKRGHLNFKDHLEFIQHLNIIIIPCSLYPKISYFIKISYFVPKILYKSTYGQKSLFFPKTYLSKEPLFTASHVLFLRFALPWVVGTGARQS